MRLLLEIVTDTLGVNQPSLLFDTLVFSLLSACPGDGRLAEMITPDGPVAVQSDDGEIVARRIGVGFLVLLRYAVSDLPWGSARCGPAGQTTANFYFLDVC